MGGGNINESEVEGNGEGSDQDQLVLNPVALVLKSMLIGDKQGKRKLFTYTF